jgi:hypothetical protein
MPEAISSAFGSPGRGGRQQPDSDGGSRVSQAQSADHDELVRGSRELRQRRNGEGCREGGAAADPGP